MNARRVFTVGSLIPGSTMISPVIPVNKKLTPVAGTTESNKREKLVILQNEIMYEILPVKGNLLETALNQGKPIQYKCRKGTCGQCTVKIIQGTKLSKPNEQEIKKLGNQLADDYRLACQVEIIL